MFVIKDAYSFSATVEVAVPGVGAPALQSFSASFTVSLDAMEEILAGRLGDQEALRRTWDGWAGIADEAGQDVPFSEPMRERLIAIPFVRLAVAKTLLDALIGRRAKN